MRDAAGSKWIAEDRIMARKPDKSSEQPDLSEARMAAIADLQISQFARFELPALSAAGLAGPVIGMPLQPLDWWLKLQGKHGHCTDCIKVLDNIEEAIRGLLDRLQPPMPGPGMPIPPPVPPTPGTTTLRQILEVLAAAREADRNLEPESARDSLREAKGMLLSEEVRDEFRRLGLGRLWKDLLCKLQDAIDCLDHLTKR